MSHSTVPYIIGYLAETRNGGLEVEVGMFGAYFILHKKTFKDIGLNGNNCPIYTLLSAVQPTAQSCYYCLHHV